VNSAQNSAEDSQGIVKLLPDLVINQIAAGEVVDRPAAIVRELVDNSIDAKATEIRVYLEEGGSGLIRVVDNGIGMGAADAERAFQRHATSKISCADDLGAITTLGFRGEALPSIASVAKVRLRTQRQRDISGSSVWISAGIVERTEGCSIAAGTDIEVRQLFFNTPARKKFLKTPRTEEARVKSWLRQSAVAHPEVQYRYYSEGREILNLTPKDTSIERAREMFKGANIAVHETIEHFCLEGLVAHPSLAEGEGGAFVLLVNGRLVSDRMILRAVRDGFDSTLKPQEYPVGFLALTVAPHLVDVNVHPQKSEVRFIAPQSVYSLVRSVVRRGVMKFSGALPQHSLAPGAAHVRYDGSAQFEKPAPLYLAEGSPRAEFRSNYTHVAQPSFRFDGAAADIVGSARHVEMPTIRFSELRFIGQAFQCFLLAEHAGHLYVVDMHAAHERIMFNKIRSARFEVSKKTQGLLIPLEISLSEHEAAQIGEFQPVLEESGFVFSLTQNSVKITEVPAFLSEYAISRIIKEIAALPEDAMPAGVLAERFDAVFARAACHASIRSGRELEREEAYALFRQMDSEELANACPHGRPVVVQFSSTEIEGWFGRDR
jgi:DNA mismatch repair protein MutL